MTTHTYWRIYSTDNNGDSYCGIAEIQMYDTINGSNIAVGGTAIGSADDSGFEAANAFDGDNGSDGTRWQATPQANQWIGYQFASAVDIVSVALTSTTFPAQAPKTWSLDYSDDGLAWTTKWSVNFGSESYVGTERRCFADPAVSRAWRIFENTNNSDSNTGLCELEFHKTVGGSQAASNGAGFGSGVQNGSFSVPFDGDTSVDWWDNKTTNAYIGYLFTSKFDVAEVVITAPTFPTQTPQTWDLQYSDDDGGTWTTVMSVTSGSDGWTAHESRTFTNTGFGEAPGDGDDGGGDSGPQQPHNRLVIITNSNF